MQTVACQIYLKVLLLNIVYLYINLSTDYSLAKNGYFKPNQIVRDMGINVNNSSAVSETNSNILQLMVFEKYSRQRYNY